jgi:hypothetical protein
VSAVETDPLTAAQVQQLADKAAAYAAAEATGVLGKHSRAAGPYSNPCCDGGGSNWKMSEVANMDIWKEGQGNNKAHWTCGPSATRNMVAAMYKHRDGYYNDFGEAQFATWEGTTEQDGTAVGNVAAALNNHFSSFGSWVTHKATDRDDYLIKVAVDTYDYHQSVIVNIDTEELSFWNGHALNHYDFDYGWDTTDSSHRYIYIAEEWDPIFIYGSSTYGNPYGKHKELLVNAYQAENKTSYHKMVV